MSAELTVRVDLNWSQRPDHVGEQELPCRCCADKTTSRDADGRPCHEGCAADEIARERVGRGRSLTIRDERFYPASPEMTGGTR